MQEFQLLLPALLEILWETPPKAVFRAVKFHQAKLQLLHRMLWGLHADHVSLQPWLSPRVAPQDQPSQIKALIIAFEKLRQLFEE
jgi:hypothetical protein